MDSDFFMDLEEVKENLSSAEVVSLYFPLLGKVLLVDVRHNPHEGPMVRLAPMVSSIEERIRSIRRMRPRFGRPNHVAILPWPKYVDSLLRLGLWDIIANRLQADGYAESVEEGLRALQELRELEHSEVLAPVKGENYESLWEQGEKG